MTGNRQADPIPTVSGLEKAATPQTTTGSTHIRSSGRGRFYLDARGNKYWSVTTIINGGVPKPALTYWAARSAAEYVANNIEGVRATLGSKKDGYPGRAAVIDLIRNAPWRTASRRADIGTEVHRAIRAYMLGAPFPEPEPEVAGLLAQFKRWLDAVSPTFEAVELAVYNAKERYAGTLDAIATIGRERLVLDVKTGSGIYPETALQLAAYRWAEFIETADGSEVPLGDLDGGAAIWVQDDRCEMIPVRTDDAVFRAFLYAREVFRWQNETSKSAVAASTPPGITVAAAVSDAIRRSGVEE